MSTLGLAGLRRSRISVVVRYLVASVAALVFLIPFYAIVKSALSTNSEINAQSFSIWPKDPQWQRIAGIVADPDFQRAMINTFVMAITSTVLSLIIAAMAGYALARIPTIWSRLGFGLVLIVLLVPSAAAFIPNFIIVASLGWVGTLKGLIIPGLFGAFNVFLFRQFYLNFPRQIEEAAMLDGMGHLGVFFRIVIPNTLPFAAALAVLGIIGSWNSFLWPLVIAGSGTGVTTVQIYLSQFLTAQTFDYGGLFMAALISLIPVLFVFIVLQRFLVKGVAETGLTG